MLASPNRSLKTRAPGLKDPGLHPPIMLAAPHKSPFFPEPQNRTRGPLKPMLSPASGLEAPWHPNFQICEPVPNISLPRPPTPYQMHT
jgi:hypothetical protein